MAAPGSTENAYMRQVISYYEMVGSFINTGLLNKELFFQSGGELLMTYLRIRPILDDVRSAWVNPQAFANLASVGEEYLDWYDKKQPGAKDAIMARLG